jgi:hypothetical protein
LSIGDAQARYWTYGKVEFAARLKAGIKVSHPFVTKTLALDIITANVQALAKKIIDGNDPSSNYYILTNSTLTISGSANPYTVDLSSVAPFISKIIRCTHVTTAGVRTPIDLFPPQEAEKMAGMGSVFSSSIWGVNEGDALRPYKGSAFTITTATDTVEVKYYRNAKIGSVSSDVLIYDPLFTVATDGITVSAFSGVVASHLGGIFLGSDLNVIKFARTIIKIVNSTSFILSSPVTAGPGDTGYIIPPNSNIYTVTRGTYVDIPDAFGYDLINMVAADFQVRAK